MKTLSQCVSRLGRPSAARLFTLLYLISLIAYAWRYLEPCIHRPWFQNSDEYVFAAETIRFLSLDFRQHFFDMPGTPFIVLTASAWSCRYWLMWLAGQIPPESALIGYTYQNLQQLFELMRTITVLFYLMSVVLTYLLARRATNRAGGFVAALLLTMSPIYASYSSFQRPESMAICLILTAAILLMRWSDRGQAIDPDSYRSLRGPMLAPVIAGLLCGVAAGARLHTVAASVPLMLLLVIGFSHRLPVERYPGWVYRFCRRAALLSLLSGAALLAAVQIDGFLARVYNPVLIREQLPKGFELLRNLALAAIAFPCVGWLAYHSGTTRRLLMRVLQPSVVLFSGGFAAGIAAGMFPVFWQLPMFVQSVQMYRSSYLDFDRLHWHWLKDVIWYVKFYFVQYSPDFIQAALFLAGVILAFWTRRWVVIAFAVAVGLFFFSRPIDLKAAPHHVLAWLPYFAIVAAYPVAWLYQRLTAVPARAAVVVITVPLIALSITHGPAALTAHSNAVLKRLRAVGEATRYMDRHAGRGDSLAIAYFCFNEFVFYEWVRQFEVPIPQNIMRGRQPIIWWGNRSTIKGKQGYACALEADVPHMTDGINHVTPGEGTNPFTELGFRVVQTFGGVPEKVFVFSFDLREPSRSAGVTP